MKGQEAELEVADLKMLRFSVGGKKIVRIGNECRQSERGEVGVVVASIDGCAGRRIQREEKPGRRI